MDAEPAAEDRAGPVVRIGDQLLLDVVDEVLALRLARPGQPDLVGRRQRGAAGRVVLVGRDDPLLEHLVEDDPAPLLRRLRVRDRVEERRVPRDPREERRLGERQLARGLLEVRQRRLPDPVRAVPEVDRVQVRGEDPVLVVAVPLLELPRERRLLQLARDRAVVGDVGVLDELLRDRRAALDDGLVLDVREQRAPDRVQVDAVVLVEALVLDRDDRLLHDRGDLIRVEDHAALLAAEHRQQLSVAVVDVAVVRDLLLVRGVVLRELARDRGHQSEHERGEREACPAPGRVPGDGACGCGARSSWAPAWCCGESARGGV